MSVFLLLLILSEVLLPNLTCASRVRRETTKVRISAIGDTIMLKFLHPDMDTKLEGYILGYGRDLFSKQFMPLPEDGEPYETEIDAEPKYLVAVQPVKGDKVKKECAGKQSKPLHLVIGSVTPTSVMLSWGTLLNTLSTETNLDDCIDDGHYTVRYREKKPRKKWSYQTCPTTVAVIDQLKPETPYEFGVRAVFENGVWSPPITHNTADDRDINKPVVPENILKSMKPITESPQASSPSVPGVSSVAPVSSAPSLQAKDMAIHKPVKSEKFPRPMKLNTESPLASSPSLPVLYTVTQSRPAYLHGPPAPPPIPRVTQDIHKPLKPEIFIKVEAPSTESPQDFSPSVPVLPIGMQTQSPASTPTHRAPTPTQRVNEDTHKPPTSENILMPDKPITESPQAFSPSVPIVHNVTHSRPASVLRHTAPPPIPRVTLGPGGDDIRTSSPSEDSLFLTQTLTSTHTPMNNLTTTNIQTHHSTTSSLSVSPQQPFHTSRSQMATNKTLFNTPNTKTNTTKTVSSTVKSQLNLPPRKRTHLKNQTQPQPESSTRKYQYNQPSTSSHSIQPFTVQLRTTQFQQHTAKYPLKTAQPKPRSPKPYIIHPQVILNQSQPSTTRGQLKMTLEPITKKSDPHSTQTQSITTQPQPLITQPQPSTTQSQPNTSQPQPITIQTQPRTTKAENSIEIRKQGTTKTQPTTMQSHSQTNQPKPIKTQNKKIQQTTVKPKLTTTQSKPPKKQQKPRKQPQPIKTQSNTGKYQPNYRSSQQPVTKQNPKFITKPKLAHERKTLKGLSTTEFQKQPDIYPTSSTIKHFNTSTWQNYQTKLTLMTKPTQPVQTPSEKPNTHYLPWHEEKPVNKISPVSKKALSQSLDGHLTKPVLVSGASDRNQGQDTSTSDFLAHTSAPTVTKRFTTVSVPNPIRMPPTNSSAKTQAPSQSLDGHLTKPVLVSGASDRNQGQDTSTSDFLAHTSAPTVTKRFSTVSVPNPIRMPPTNSSAKTQAYYGKYWDKSHKGPKKPESNEIEKQTNQVDKDESDDKVIDLKVVGAVPDMKPSPAPPIMDQKTTPTTTPFFAINGSRYNIGDNSSIFSSVPVSEVDPMGKKRFIAPHVIYQIDKPPEKPCSVTNALSHFPEEENEVTSISGPPKTAPTNLTVVTVEGCPSFVIIDWDGTDNETTAYEVTSSVKSPNGQVVSVVTTNQTHTAVENLKPESSYEFTVTPKNELGSGPSSEPVSFNTESADPRVSKVPTGKNAIWSSFSFKADGYSECTGTQFVKRTWYRKFVGIQLCNSLRYKIYLSDSLKGKFYNIGDETGYGEDHCQFVDSFLDGRTGGLLPPYQLPLKQGFFRAMRQEPVRFGKIGGNTQINYVAWYECGVPIPGSW